MIFFFESFSLTFIHPKIFISRFELTKSGRMFGQGRKRQRSKKTDSVPPAPKRPREKKPKLPTKSTNWRPPQFDFVFDDTWWYEVSFNKQRMTLNLCGNPVENVNNPEPPPPLELPASSSSSSSSVPTNTSTNSNVKPQQLGGAAKRRRKTAVIPNPFICVQRTVQLLIPSFLTRSLWSRHGYTLNDILYTLQCFKPFHLWHLAISERLSLTKLAVQPSYAARDSFVFGAKAIVIEHLKNWIQSTYQAPEPEINVLTNMEGSHVPPLPVHRIPDIDFDSLVSMLPKEGGNGLEIAIYTFPLPPIWRGVLMLPVEMERGNFLLMSRVLPAEEYLEKFGVPECLTMTPIRVQMSDGSKYCILDESWHFISQCNTSLGAQPSPEQAIS